jgi:hypothetical protein
MNSCYHLNPKRNPLRFERHRGKRGHEIHEEKLFGMIEFDTLRLLPRLVL